MTSLFLPFLRRLQDLFAPADFGKAGIKAHAGPDGRLLFLLGKAAHVPCRSQIAAGILRQAWKDAWAMDSVCHNEFLHGAVDDVHRSFLYGAGFCRRCREASEIAKMNLKKCKMHLQNRRYCVMLTVKRDRPSPAWMAAPIIKERKYNDETKKLDQGPVFSAGNLPSFGHDAVGLCR